MRFLLDFLEKGSAWLDKVSKPMEGKMAYFFCFTQIVICLAAISASAIFFTYNFLRHDAFEVRVSLIIFLVAISLLLGSYVRLLITRDLKYLRNLNPNKKESTEKKRKIEF